MRIFNFTRLFKINFVISGIIILAGLISIVLHKGLELGIDFTGGVQITYLLDKAVSVNEIAIIRNELLKKNISGDIQTSRDNKELFIKIKGLSYIDDAIEEIGDLREEGRIISEQDVKDIFKKVPQDVVFEFSKRYSYLPNQILPDINKTPLVQLEETAKSIYTNMLSHLLFNIMHTIFAKDIPLDKFDINYINSSDEINEIISSLQARRLIDNLQNIITNQKRIEKLDELLGFEELKGVSIDRLQLRFTTKKVFQTEELKLNINEALEDRMTLDEYLKYTEADRIYKEFYDILKDLNLQTARKLIIHKTNIGGLYSGMQEIEELEDVRPICIKDIKDNFVFGNFVLGSNETVGPSIGATLKKQALAIILLSFLVMGVYIVVRFDLSFALGAILSLIHDITLTAGLVSILEKEFDIPLIASIMALIGYSLNDTIVVYDRIRENLGLRKRAPMDEIINLSISQTLSRTLITSLTTLFAAVALYFFGPITTKNFALVFIIGIITGTYSSIFIAAPVVLFMDRRKLIKQQPAVTPTISS
ncbi:MAG: protein translocase subunit SecF [Candidatus Hydrogenedentota bacterium]